MFCQFITVTVICSVTLTVGALKVLPCMSGSLDLGLLRAPRAVFLAPGLLPPPPPPPPFPWILPQPLYILLQPMFLQIEGGLLRRFCRSFIFFGGGLYCSSLPIQFIPYTGMISAGTQSHSPLSQRFKHKETLQLMLTLQHFCSKSLFLQRKHSQHRPNIRKT